MPKYPLTSMALSQASCCARDLCLPGRIRTSGYHSTKNRHEVSGGGTTVRRILVVLARVLFVLKMDWWWRHLWTYPSFPHVVAAFEDGQAL